MMQEKCLDINLAYNQELVTAANGMELSIVSGHLMFCNYEYEKREYSHKEVAQLGPKWLKEIPELAEYVEETEAPYRLVYANVPVEVITKFIAGGLSEQRMHI